MQQAVPFRSSRFKDKGMADARSELQIEIGACADDDDQELAELTQRLRNELLDLDVEDVTLARSADVAVGAKGIDATAVAGLIVHLGSGPAGMLGSVSACVRDWLQRQRARSVKLTLDGDTLEVTGVSSAEQDQLIEMWVGRHTAPR